MIDGRMDDAAVRIREEAPQRRERVDRNDVAERPGPPRRRSECSIDEQLRERRMDRHGVERHHPARHGDADASGIDREAVHRGVQHVGGERRVHCLRIEAASLHGGSRGERRYRPPRHDAPQVEQPQVRLEIVSLFRAREIEGAVRGAAGRRREA